MPHDKTPSSDDIAALKARLDFVERQYKSLQLNMKYQREAFLRGNENHFLLKLAPRRYRSLKQLKDMNFYPYGWLRLMWRKPLKFGLWWTVKKLQSRDWQKKSGENFTDKMLYQHVESIIAGKKFSHVFFMPLFSRAGGEKYILNIIDDLYRQNPTEPILMIVCADYVDANWEEKLPFGVDYLDLSIFYHHVDFDKRYDVAFQLAQTTSGENTSWHFQVSGLCSYFFEKYGEELEKRHVIFYHFCNYVKFSGDIAKENDDIYQEIEENFNLIDKIISDNQRILDEDKVLLEKKGLDTDQKFTCIYTKTEILRSLADMPPDTPLHPPRIFWASRLDRHKRRSLIFAIGKKMLTMLPDKTLDVYGYSVFDHNFQYDKLPSSVKFHGAFNGLASLDIKPCDILLYTSHVDGLPNVILEAISLGAVVIAPDVGGIGDIIKNNETGILLPNIADDEAMAELYIHALKKLLEDDNSRLKLAQNAQKLLQKNHAPAIFAENIRKIFG